MNKNKKKKIWIIPTLTVALAVVLAVCWKTDVFGKFVPQEPYVEGEPQLMNAGDNPVVVNYEGSNLKGEDGSGATPCSEEVPTCVGKKGSETNPFVILEIVADHAQQQMRYLAQEDDGNTPLDVMQIGIDASKEKNHSFKGMGIDNFDYLKKLGDWFCKSEWAYEVYKIGKVDKKEEMPFASIDKLYSFQITPDDIKKAGYSEEEFAKHYEEIRNDGVKSFIEKYYPKLFEKDESGKAIRDIALEDKLNWDVNFVERGDIHYDVVFTSEDLVRDNNYRWNLNVSEIFQENPNVFLRDSSGNDISENIRNDVANWTGECTKTDSYDYTVITKDIAEEDYNEYLNGKMQMKDLIGKYSNLFQKDKNGKEIEKSRLGVNEWELKKEEGELPTILDSGYVHYVGNGGEYSYEVNWGTGQQELREKKDENGQKVGEWEYLEKLPDGANKGDKDNWWFGNNKNPEYYWSVSELEKACNNWKVAKIEKAKLYTFTYKKDISHYKLSYNGGNKKKVYSFEYWGLRNNNILKRQLFQFKDQEDYDNFHMKVITMTPSEINEMVNGAKPDTLDIIERADMFYIGSYNGQTDNLEQVYDLYYDYIAKKDDFVYSQDNIKSFYENDLDWISCYKILYRLCNSPNLPLMLTQGLGEMVNEGVDGNNNTHMYVTETWSHKDAKGSLNNMAKLYLLSVQFDMLARKSDGYKRTFYDDILQNLKMIGLANGAMEKADKNTASTTGYYERKLVETDCNGNVLTDDAKSTCYYLWNMWTFYPSDIELSSGAQKEADIDTYVQYGYLRSFFDSNADVFNDGVEGHHSGSDGQDGKNVGIVHAGSNSNQNQSTLLGSTGVGQGVFNNTMNVAYQIMNNRPEFVNPQIVKLKKQKKEYVKMSDSDALVDYSSEQSYSAGDKSYLKILINNNNNNRAGVVTKVTLKNSAGESAPTDSKLVLYSSKDYSEECKKVQYGYYAGYDIPTGGDMIVYVPYSLKQWADGYNIVEFETVGRIYNEKKERIITGSPVKTDISINERTLFDLE